MSASKPTISNLKLKRYEHPQSYNAKILSRISCKIGGHFLNVYINTGNSISIASSDLYRKLIDGNYAFKEGNASLHIVDDIIPNQQCRITPITIKVVGKTKVINLVAFPNFNIKQTVLGMDFVSSSSKSKSKENECTQLPEQPILKPITSNQPTDKEHVDKEQPVALLDWILDSSNLQTPLYNILSGGNATDQDLYAICAFMKRIPRSVSPIRRLEKPRPKRLAEIKASEIQWNKKSTDKSSIAPVTSAKPVKR